MISNQFDQPVQRGFPPAAAAAPHEFSLAAATDGPSPAAAAAVGPLARAAGPHPLYPDAWIYGAGTGALVPAGMKGAAFLVSPTGNPFDFTTEDGSPSNSIFVSKVITSGSINPATSFSRAAVGTYNPGTGALELGYGGVVKIDVLGTPVLGFLNARANPPANFTGTVAANFGALFSVDQAAAGALSALSGAAAMIPTPKTAGAAAGMRAASETLRAVGQVGSGFTGVGYRVELKFKEGDLEGIYYKGRKIDDLEGFVRNAVGGARRHQPPVIPNGGSSHVANVNYTNQLIFGTSPWSLAATSGGRNHGNGAVAVANTVLKLAGDAGLVGNNHTISSMAEAGRLLDSVVAKRGLPNLGAMIAGDKDQAAYYGAMETLRRYDLDFGSNSVKAYFATLPDQPRPGDYQFVRNAFQGNYRHHGDNPAGGSSGGRIL